MLRSTAGKVAWLARATTTLVGLAIMLALVFGVATTAMSATGKPFILGKQNTAGKVTQLIRHGAGAALRLEVRDGQPPMKVNSDAKVANLNADMVDGRSAQDLKGQQGPEGPEGPQGAPGEPRYTRTVVVSPEDGATSTENGDALLEALAGIQGATAESPRLLYIEPGTYDLGTDSLEMKQYVDIEGSGELATTITSAISNVACNTGTVRGANDAEMRFLAVQNTGTGPDDCGFGIYNEDASPRLTSMSVTASGGVENVFGVYNVDSSPVMTDVSVTAAPASGNSIGVADDGNSSPTIRDSVIVAEDSGIYAADGSGTIRVDGSRIEGGAKTIFIDGEGFTTLVGASQLDGGPVVVISTSTTTCAGVYDESYNFFPSTCP